MSISLKDKCSIFWLCLFFALFFAGRVGAVNGGENAEKPECHYELPAEIWSVIFQFVGNEKFGDLCNARLACKVWNALILADPIFGKVIEGVGKIEGCRVQLEELKKVGPEVRSAYEQLESHILLLTQNEDQKKDPKSIRESKTRIKKILYSEHPGYIDGSELQSVQSQLSEFFSGQSAPRVVAYLSPKLNRLYSDIICWLPFISKQSGQESGEIRLVAEGEAMEDVAAEEGESMVDAAAEENGDMPLEFEEKILENLVANPCISGGAFNPVLFLLDCSINEGECQWGAGKLDGVKVLYLLARYVPEELIPRVEKLRNMAHTCLTSSNLARRDLVDCRYYSDNIAPAYHIGYFRNRKKHISSLRQHLLYDYLGKGPKPYDYHLKSNTILFNGSPIDQCVQKYIDQMEDKFKDDREDCIKDWVAFGLNGTTSLAQDRTGTQRAASLANLFNCVSGFFDKLTAEEKFRGLAAFALNPKTPRDVLDQMFGFVNAIGDETQKKHLLLLLRHHSNSSAELVRLAKQVLGDWNPADKDLKWLGITK